MVKKRILVGSKEVISGGEQAQGMFQTNAAQFFLPNNVPQNALGNTGVQASMEMLSKDQALGDPEFGSLSLSSANMHPLKTPQDSTQNALTHSQTSNANFTVAQPSGGKSFEQIQTGFFPSFLPSSFFPPKCIRSFSKGYWQQLCNYFFSHYYSTPRKIAKSIPNLPASVYRAERNLPSVYIYFVLPNTVNCTL